MKTTKTYVRKYYYGRYLVYAYPEGLAQLAIDRGTRRDEDYELVTETVSSISSAELDTMVTDGLGQHEGVRLAEKLGKEV